MQYKDVRDKIKSGDILAWTHKEWGSWYNIQVQMVRFFTESEYCHVAVAYVLGPRVFVIEAVSTGVRIFPLSRLTPFYWIPRKDLPYVPAAYADVKTPSILTTEQTPTSYRVAPAIEAVEVWSDLKERFLLQQVGKRYENKLGMVLAHLGFNRSIVNNDLRWQCAELVVRAMSLACETEPSAVVEYLQEKEGCPVYIVNLSPEE